MHEIKLTIKTYQWS